MKKIAEQLSFTRKERLAMLAIALMVLVLCVQRYFFVPLPDVGRSEVKVVVENEVVQEQHISNKEEETKHSTPTKRFNKKPTNKKPLNTSPKVNNAANKKKLINSRPERKEAKRARFNFNPNIVSEDSLVQLGFQPWMAKNWVKFRESGKKYYSEKDLLSIYGIDSSLVKVLKPHIEYPAKKKFTSYSKKSYNKVDLNSASQAELESLPGIGPSFASRIIKYRKMLGGYANKSQLKEVYGLSDSLYQSIKHLILMESPAEKILINVLSQDSLARHFLVSYKHAKLICNYRKQHGPFLEEKDFEKLMGITDEEKQKIMPYLDFKI